MCITKLWIIFSVSFIYMFIFRLFDLDVKYTDLLCILCFSIEDFFVEKNWIFKVKSLKVQNNMFHYIIVHLYKHKSARLLNSFSFFFFIFEISLFCFCFFLRVNVWLVMCLCLFCARIFFFSIFSSIHTQKEL